ncbi:MAG: formate dehydrogenase accessory sulfurtransferase FdhD [Gammaproteobacteria bacterium]
MLVAPAALTLQPVAGAPQLSAACCDLTQEIEIIDEYGKRRPLAIPAERPLTIYIDGRELVTLMTLGARPELLVLGYLHNQRLLGAVADIESIEVDWQRSAAAVTTRTGVQDLEAKTARRVVTTGCGQGTVFGDLMNQIAAIDLPAAAVARIRQRTLYQLLETMRELESLHRSAGSVHGCALFHGAELLVFVEDVGRHNAIDTIIGWMALHGVAGGDKIFYTTGRMTSEMVMKSAQIGVPIVVSRNGATAMGYEVANKLGMSLIGRAVRRRFICYAGAERFDMEPETRDDTP